MLAAATRAVKIFRIVSPLPRWVLPPRTMMKASLKCLLNDITANMNIFRQNHAQSSSPHLVCVVCTKDHASFLFSLCTIAGALEAHFGCRPPAGLTRWPWWAKSWTRCLHPTLRRLRSRRRRSSRQTRLCATSHLRSYLRRTSVTPAKAALHAFENAPASGIARLGTARHGIKGTLPPC